MDLEKKTDLKGVLLINVGTPDSPKTSDVRKYLKEFLSDPRVMDLPAFMRFLILWLVIIPFRAGKSAKLYKEIWTPNGSPLLVHSKALQSKLQETLGSNYVVALGMAYGNPSIASALEQLRSSGVTSTLVFPLFPQYASATTGAVLEQVMSQIKTKQVIQEHHFMNSFYDDDGFIDAWSEIGKRYLTKKFDHIVFSYHGLPHSQIKKADASGKCLSRPDCCESICAQNKYCYSAQCYATTRLLTEKMGISKSTYSIAFQSRLGKMPWLQPYLSDEVKRLAQEGKKNILVFCPSFVADCLETTHEIGDEYNELFVEAGGEKLELVESLNSDENWVAALADMCRGKF